MPPRGPEPGAVGLLAAVLAGTPRLEGAACVPARGRFHEAENGSQVPVAECISLCSGCQALEACRNWADGQPDLVGVIAGKFRGSVRRDDELAREAR